MRKNNRFYMLILIISIISLTTGYSLINRQLNINGNSSVKQNTWDIHLDNIRITPGSINNTTPVLNQDKLLVNFSTTLNLPGDFYEFNVDIKNSGTIDAMIDSISKTPELTEAQKKYINYIIEYQNGEQITTKQLLSKESFLRLKIRVEYRSDITEFDLPTTTQNLNLGFTVNFIQADKTANNVTNNSVYVLEKISGTGTNIGDELCIKDECFYVIKSTSETITMLSKYNLHVGNQYNVSDDIVTPLAKPKYKQDPTAIGYFRGNSATNPLIGTMPFSSTNYWGSTTTYPLNIYNENSNLYTYVEDYKLYLNSLGLEVNKARLITYEELEELGCNLRSNMCTSAPSFVYLTTYWTASAGEPNKVWNVISNGYSYADLFNCNRRGIRPVIEISKSLI